MFAPPLGLWHTWAYGTYRQNACYRYAGGPCAADYVWHVGGVHGIDVGRIPDGDYQYCVQDITINGVRDHRCAPVTIHHR